MDKIDKALIDFFDEFAVNGFNRAIGHSFGVKLYCEYVFARRECLYSAVLACK